MRLAILATTAALTLTACTRGGGEGPDEFAVMPVRPLEIPADLNRLPPPTPGGANRAEQAPLAEAVQALGGNPAAARPAYDSPYRLR